MESNGKKPAVNSGELDPPSLKLPPSPGSYDETRWRTGAWPSFAEASEDRCVIGGEAGLSPHRNQAESGSIKLDQTGSNTDGPWFPAGRRKNNPDGCASNRTWKRKVMEWIIQNRIRLNQGQSGWIKPGQG